MDRDLKEAGHFLPVVPRRDRQHLAGGAVRRIFLPAHRSERPFQHTADPHRVGPQMKIPGALMQRALRLRRAIALAQKI